MNYYEIKFIVVSQFFDKTSIFMPFSDSRKSIFQDKAYT